jgi:hypothetical protein
MVMGDQHGRQAQTGRGQCRDHRGRIARVDHGRPAALAIAQQPDARFDDQFRAAVGIAKEAA